MSLKSQRLAQKAYDRIDARKAKGEKYQKEYRSFAREFPTLVHQCGLAQAVAFAQAKGKTSETHRDYLADLAAVLAASDRATITGTDALGEQTRSLPAVAYVRLSRDALDAAVWLKRYVEALFEDTKKGAAS